MIANVTAIADRQRKMRAIATTANVTAIADRRSKMKRLPAQNESDCDGRQRDSDRRPPTQNESDRDDRHGHWQITGDARRKHNETGFSRHIAGAAAVGANKRRHGTPHTRQSLRDLTPSVQTSKQTGAELLVGHASTARLREPELHSMAMSTRPDLVVTRVSTGASVFPTTLHETPHNV